MFKAEDQEVKLPHLKRVFEQPRGAAHLERRGHVEAAAVRLGVLTLANGDERLELGRLLQLGVAVEQQCGVVRRRQAMCVRRLQVRGEALDAPRVQKLPDHV